jgi:hypothetical protein
VNSTIPVAIHNVRSLLRASLPASSTICRHRRITLLAGVLGYHADVYSNACLRKHTYIARNYIKNERYSIDKPDKSTIGWGTISSDQADDILQDQIFFLGWKSDRKCLCNEAADIPVNTIPAARSDMGIYNLQSSTSCHATIGCPENVIQDHGEVHDVAHHASNIFLANMHETEQPVGDTSRWSLTCLDIHHKPNPRACRQIHSSHYRQFNHWISLLIV